MFRGEHINFLAQVTLGQPAVCPKAIWTLTRAKSLFLCAFFLPDWEGARESARTKVPYRITIRVPTKI